MATEWVTITNRTNDPKLAFFEHLLTEAKISHKRDGHSFHGPIIKVPHYQESIAADILHKLARKQLSLPVRGTVTLDDLPDDHNCFYAEGKRPGAMFEECEAHWVYPPTDWINPNDTLLV